LCHHPHSAYLSTPIKTTHKEKKSKIEKKKKNEEEKGN
jgi:hypothetical protein